MKKLFSLFLVLALCLSACCAGIAEETALTDEEAGFAAFLALWFGAEMIDWLQWRHTPKPVFEPLHLWQTALGVLALFAVCAVNLRLQIRKHMQYSIVENIREL